MCCATARSCARAAWWACAAPGLAFDGMHYVDSTTHKLKPGEYKQSFVLKRNALISNMPLVPAMPY